MLRNDLLLVKVYHGGKFVGNQDYVGGECFVLRDWDLEAFGDRFVTEVMLIDDNYSKVIKYAFKNPSSKEFIFVKDDDYKSSITQCINRKRGVLEVYLELGDNGDNIEVGDKKGTDGDNIEVSDKNGNDGDNIDVGDQDDDDHDGDEEEDDGDQYEFDWLIHSEEEDLDDGMSDALSCILHRREDPESYVDTFYCKSTLAECYKHSIGPLRGPKHWPLVEGAPILPPHFSRLPGRPKKTRKRAADDTADKSSNKLSARGMKMSCRNCGAFGHNKRTCDKNSVEKASSSSKTKPRQPRAKGSTRTTSNSGTPRAGQPRAPLSSERAKDLSMARKGVGAYTSTETGNIYLKSSTTQRVRYVSGSHAGIASRSTPNVDGSQESQVINSFIPPRPK